MGEDQKRETHSSHWILGVRMCSFSFFLFFFSFSPPTLNHNLPLVRCASVFYDEASDILRLPPSPDLDSLSLPSINLCTSS